MAIETFNGGTVITGPDIANVRLLAVRSALHLETLGLKRRGRSMLAVVKREFNLTGNTRKVYEQFNKIVTEKTGIQGRPLKPL